MYITIHTMYKYASLTTNTFKIPTTDVSKYKWFVYACMYEWIVITGIKRWMKQVTDPVVTTVGLQVTTIVCM